MKKVITLFVGLIFCITVTYADSKVDSLELLLQPDVQDTTQLNILFELATILSKNDFERGLFYSKKLFTQSKALKNDIKLAQAYALIGGIHFKTDYNLDSIIQFSKKGLVIAERIQKVEVKNDILRNIGLAHLKSGELNKAFGLFQEVVTNAKKAGLDIQLIVGLSNIALVPYYQKDFEKSQEYFFEALKIAKSIKNEEYIAFLSNNIAEVYKDVNELDSALVYYTNALSVNKRLGNTTRVAIILSNIGDAYVKLKDYKKADKYLNEGYKLAKENNYKRALAVNLYYLSQSYFNQKKYEKSIQSILEGLEFQGDNGFMTRRRDFYKLLSLNYEAIGNYKGALEYRKSFEVLNDSLFNINKNEQIQSLEIKYKVQQKEVENQQLKEKQEVAQKTIRNQALAAIGLVLALLSAIGWGIFIFRTNKRRKKLNEILEIKVKERTKELEQANYELRTFNYIASHDIKEPIRVIAGYAGLIFRKLPIDLKENLGEYFDTIKRSTTQLYTLIEDFATYTTMSKNEKIKKEAVDLNLLTISVVEQLKETISKYDGEVLVTNLPTIQTGNSLLFTTLKNLIENGLKYNQSEKPTVNINYEKTETHHQIIVSDNGIGINKEYHEKIFEMFKRLHNRSVYEGSGIGLAIVKLSIEKLGGTIRLESKEGKGSRFVIELPFS